MLLLLVRGQLFLPQVVGDLIPLSPVTDGLDRVAAGRSRSVLDITALMP